jgi:hypothetical protein
MSSSYLLIFAAVIIGLTIVVWSGLWRLYRWLFVMESEIDSAERLILERQIVAMMIYFPVHLSAIVLPVADPLRGLGSVFAAFVLAFIGISAVRHRLFVAFNRHSFQDAAAIREGMAVAAGWLLLILAFVILAIGMYLLQ